MFIRQHKLGHPRRIHSVPIRGLQAKADFNFLSTDNILLDTLGRYLKPKRWWGTTVLDTKDNPYKVIILY